MEPEEQEPEDDQFPPPDEVEEILADDPLDDKDIPY